MSDLTPEELDALTRDGAGAAPAGGGPAAVVTLDLTRPERSLRGALPGLELALDRLARTLGTSLRPFLGVAPAVTLGALELVRFGRVVEPLGRPLGLQLLRVAPLRGYGVLVFAAPLAAAALEVAFGGTRGRQARLEGRELSALELRALERFGTRVAQDLAGACRPLLPLECAVVRSETNPAHVPLPADELVMLIEFRLAAGDAEEHALPLCLPWAAVDAVHARLATPPGREAPAAPADDAWGEPLRALLADTELEVTAELGRRALSVREVLALRVGDVVALGTGRDGPVVVRVEGQPRFLGAPGVSGTQHAVRLTARL